MLLGGGKLAGLLIDRADGALVIGIGVNLAVAPAVPAYRTAALADAAAPPAPGAFLAALDEALTARLGQQFGRLRADWLAAATGLDGPVTVRLPNGAAWSGDAEGLDAHGGLLVRTPEGLRTANAGDVFFSGGSG